MNVAEFEKLIRKYKIKPFTVIQDLEHGDIYLADSGQAIIDKNGSGWTAFYRTLWAVFRGEEGFVGSYNDYPVTDFNRYTERGAQEKRINEAIEFARKFLTITAQSGLYDHARKDSFSQIIH